MPTLTPTPMPTSTRTPMPKRNSRLKKNKEYISAAANKKIIDDIHTEAVKKSIAKLEPNPLLNAPPPPISPSEATLTRKQRTTLAQLRSGQCQLLNDYKVLTGRAQSALCPECLFRRHTVPHIFECDAAPTNLNIRDLWINPKTVVNYLVSLPSFACLLPTGPPPPRPPPEPPPPPP